MACSERGSRMLIMDAAVTEQGWTELPVDCEEGDDETFQVCRESCIAEMPERVRPFASAPGPFHRLMRPWRRRQGVVGLLLVVAAAASVWGFMGGGGRGDRARTNDEELVQKQVLGAGAEGCDAGEQNVDYVLYGDFLMLVETVMDAGTCCQYCRSEERCHAWSWVEDATLVDSAGPGECWLKGGRVIQSMPRPGLISALVDQTPGLSVAPVPDGSASIKDVSASATRDAEQAVATTDAKHKILAVGATIKVIHAEAAKETTTATTTLATVAPTTTTTEAVPLNENCTVDEDDGLNCLKSECCKEPGMQCFRKDDYWAQCMETCIPGPNLFDSSSDPWVCEPLGARAPGSPKHCSQDHDNCAGTQCCSSAGLQCYAKNATFARCKPSCTPGVDMGDSDSSPWSCDELGDRSPVPAAWVQEKCAKDFEDCSKSRCCATTGMQCFLQNEWYGQCKPACKDTESEKCNAAGPVTPRLNSAISKDLGTVGEWVLPRCSDQWEDCSSSQCCHEVGAQCYRKDSKYATCKTTCSTEPDINDNNVTWDCTALGPRSWGLALRGFPSLFCFSLYMPSGYERGILQYQLETDAGIFACDGFQIFAAENDTLRSATRGMQVEAELIPKISVGVSQDNTAGNAKLFMAVWDRVLAIGRYRNFDWTIKADPDAVLLPWRLRSHMLDHNGEQVYVVNCNKFPSSPNFPMMYGALEVFSQSAMKAYAAGSGKCGTELPWKLWGEDYYMTHCMDFLGVRRIGDFSVLGDDMCTGAHCDDETVASFHPFKSVYTWASCWATANGLPQPSSTTSTTSVPAPAPPAAPASLALPAVPATLVTWK